MNQLHVIHKPSASIAAYLLAEHGVRCVFCSSGSRCAPLNVAMLHTEGLRVESVVDERSAAFMALGYADISRQPVALVCTSGTALLNYLPAIAEAHYRKLPLIVLSADRPRAWIDQDDSQTLHQPDALAPYTKVCVDIPDVSATDPQGIWQVERDINNAIHTALQRRQGPVHINMRFDEPLTAPCTPSEIAIKGKIEFISPLTHFSTAEARALAAELASPRKVLVVCGFMPPDRKIQRAMSKLARKENVVVLAENLANLHCAQAIERIDTLLSLYDGDLPAEMVPDVVISSGGALVSRKLKNFLRRSHVQEHWHVGFTDNVIDCFQALTRRIEMSPEQFFPAIASGILPHSEPSSFSVLWHQAERRGIERLHTIAESHPWGALKATATIASSLPAKANVQVSNGTSVRYMMLADTRHIHRIDCNRGVSGIDGSTSTAVGASLATGSERPTILVTGDMSLQYDLTALGTSQISPRLKVIVMENGGGGIFRYIPSTCHLPELEQAFVLPGRFPIADLARAWQWQVYEASSESSLSDALPRFLADSSAPTLLIVHTDGTKDARLLSELLH